MTPRRLEGKPNRTYLRSSRVTIWTLNGFNHNLDGPAVTTPFGRNWWVYGEPISKKVEQWILNTGIEPDHDKWGPVEKTLFRLRFE